MVAGQLDRRKFAEQVVEVYASRVRLTLLAQGELERDVMSRIAQAAERGETAAPAVLANEALAHWEQRFETRGPRITLVGNGRVVEKRQMH
jgi:hypothetical protein